MLDQHTIDNNFTTIYIYLINTCSCICILLHIVYMFALANMMHIHVVSLYCTHSMYTWCFMRRITSLT